MIRYASLFLVLLMAAREAHAGTNIYIDNRSGMSLTMETQPPEELPRKAWKQTRSEAPAGASTAFLWLGRDDGVTDGKWFHITSTVSRGDDHLELYQALLGESINSQLWQSAGSMAPRNDRKKHWFSWVLGDGSYIPVEYWAQEFADNPMLNDDVYYVFHAPRQMPEAEREGLRILAYNTYLKPGILGTDLGGTTESRARAMLAHMMEYDVLVISELFDGDAQRIFEEGLRERYPHHSEEVDEDDADQDSGVTIFSRWPIVAQDQVVYSESSGSDWFANKGAAYVAIEKDRIRYHIVGTHTQADPAEAKARIRQSQFRQVMAMVERQGIGSREPLVFAGDLNVDSANTRELDDMLETLQAQRPTVIPGGIEHSYEPGRNARASGDRENLDYVLFSKQHLPPKQAVTKIIRLMENGKDLSDHHAIAAYLAFVDPGDGEAVTQALARWEGAGGAGGQKSDVVGIIGLHGAR